MAKIRVEAYSEGATPAAVVIAEAIPVDVAVTFSRVVDGKVSVLRAGKNVALRGAGHVVDWDMPIGRDITYLVEYGSTRLEATYRYDSDYGYFTSPLDPTIGITIGKTLTGGTDGFLTYLAATKASFNATANLVNVIGSRYPIAIGGTRQAAEELEIKIGTLSPAKIQALVEASSVWIARFPPWTGLELEPVAYVLCEKVEKKNHLSVDKTAPLYTEYSTEGMTVRAFSAPIVFDPWTNARVQELYKGVTYAQVQAGMDSKHYTYADARRDPRMGGIL
ncbi:hypothetical protein R6G85_02385 [Actinotignum urinale]|uniref:Uncharacterized protein n=1 Tax=Actinotignum urinale TaxID=190146 RepID=A0ABU5G858_9ACTO|nr:hypothetical protein [Actinotignum urinale]MDY5132236.1 hypothetical protein [Actinotignum urinale]MDY5151335.1 hypothetical protein [Actinotignum urinale]